MENLLVKIRDLDIRFRIFARVEDLDEKVCLLLKEAGCLHISIGLESLNPENLMVLGKKSQIAKEMNVKIAKDAGLIVRASFMVGLPYDTDQSIEDSFTKAACLNLDEFAIYPLIPYPGTILWKEPWKFGYTIENKDFNDYVQIGKEGRTCYAMQHKNFTRDDVMRWHRTATNILLEKGIKHMKMSNIAK